MSVQHTDARRTDRTHTIPEPADADNGRKALADLLWWVTPAEFDRWVSDEISVRDLGRIAVERADERGARISPDLRDDAWYDEYRQTGRVQR